MRPQLRWLPPEREVASTALDSAGQALLEAERNERIDICGIEPYLIAHAILRTTGKFGDIAISRDVLVRMFQHLDNGSGEELGALCTA